MIGTLQAVGLQVNSEHDFVLSSFRVHTMLAWTSQTPGECVGVLDGVADGAFDGVLDGEADGAFDGVMDGEADGAFDGLLDGEADG